MRSSPLCWALGLIASAAQASAGSSFSSSSSSGAVVAEPRGIPNVHTARQAAAAAAAAPAYWYSQVLHNGASPTIANGNNWTVFRNVRDFGAKGDGVADDSAAINRAILLGNAQGDRASGVFGITQQPAVVYFPSGTYLVNRAVQNLVDTVLMGDPTDRPLIKAGPLFNETTLLVGRDPKVAGLGAFQFEIKNLVLDSTALATRSAFNLLSWDVSQACQLSNVLFNMPVGSNHVGIIAPTTASPLMINDLQFIGGGIGFNVTVTQYHFKNILFRNIATGLKLTNMNSGTGQGLRFENVQVGIDARGGGSGFFALIDSTATNTTMVVAEDQQQFTMGSLVLENVMVDATVPATVNIGGTAALTGNVTPGTTWIRGHVYANGGAASAAPQNFAMGQLFTSSRPANLVNSSGSYFTVTPPTYADFDVSRVVNVKSVAAHPVAGDAASDDLASLQAIINDAAKANQLVFFPHGIYLLSDTLTIPANSRLVGEAFTELSAFGNNFKNAASPRPMIRVGNAGDRGLAQMTDFIFTVADILPGAVLVEVNMAGTQPGDVGFFNNHFRIAGAAGSGVQLNCADPQTCNAARTLVHLTPSSSAYWENAWLWGADHDLENLNATDSPSAAGGLLVEATGGTWLLGLGVEHHALYQSTLFNARNVFIGLQQGEAAYWQGNGTVAPAPQPWQNVLQPSDPDYSWCAAGDQQCRMGLYQRVINSSDVNIYASGFWNFVAGPQRTFCATDCQDNAAQFAGNQRFFSYGLSTINNANSILESGIGGDSNIAAAEKTQNAANAGGVQAIGMVGAVVAAYLRQSGDGAGATTAAPGSVVVSSGAGAGAQSLLCQTALALPAALLVVPLFLSL